MFSESDGYERFMGRWSRRLAPLFVTFAGVTEGDRVLDVGSGTGALSAAAAAIDSVQVTGIERSAAYVRYAREHVERPVRGRRRDGAAVPSRRLRPDTVDARAELRPGSGRRAARRWSGSPVPAVSSLRRCGTTATACRCCGRSGTRPSRWIPTAAPRDERQHAAVLRAGRSRSSGGRTGYRMSTSNR